MAPLVNAEYYFSLTNNYYLGAKFLYKYFGQEQFDQTWSSKFVDRSYQTVGLRTTFIQDFYFLFSAAYGFSSYWYRAFLSLCKT